MLPQFSTMPLASLAIRESYNLFIVLFLAYLVLVRSLRYKRASKIAANFGPGKRPFSSMTTQEAFHIISELQTLEFPYAFNKARETALLKAGAIPTMSKLFAATGQNNRRNAGKRTVDTEILLREAQVQSRASERYMNAVARMNYLHSRYRKAGKILDKDLLHTLGDGAAEIVRIVDGSEWRKLSDVEKCAIGVFHKNLGEDMEIPFTPLKSSIEGWEDGLHFADELVDWTVAYEKEVAKPTEPSDLYVRVYVDSATSALGNGFTTVIRKILGSELDDTMRTSLNLEAPGPILVMVLTTIKTIRRLALRHLFLPRPSFMAYKHLEINPNPVTGLLHFNHSGLQPWYIKPTFWTKWSPSALLLRALGGRAPGSRGDRYQPGGYDLKTIGPAPQQDKGLEEMETTVELIKARGAVECPFSQAKKRQG